jgi:hypothetical protein
MTSIVMSLESLGRGGLLGGFAEHAAAALAQAGALTAHAGGDALDIGNFRGAKPEHIAGTKPSLVILGEAMGGRRQHRKTQHQTSKNGSRDISTQANRKPCNGHRHAPGPTEWCNQTVGRPRHDDKDRIDAKDDPARNLGGSAPEYFAKAV